eukprot:1156319-Pelagomonas_calceolata.AAC.22
MGRERQGHAIGHAGRSVAHAGFNDGSADGAEGGKASMGGRGRHCSVEAAVASPQQDCFISITFINSGSSSSNHIGEIGKGGHQCSDSMQVLKQQQTQKHQEVQRSEQDEEGLFLKSEMFTSFSVQALWRYCRAMLEHLHGTEEQTLET